MFVCSQKFFNTFPGGWVQIVNTTPRIGGWHWVVLSMYEIDNTDAEIPVINVCNSLWTGNTSDSMLAFIQSILFAPQVFIHAGLLKKTYNEGLKEILTGKYIYKLCIKYI